jgi:hypothetical protein
VNVFLGWSGPRSGRVATVLRNYLHLAFPHIVFWISEDISPGSRWNWELGTHLSDARVGIICVTRENLQSPWLLFEAGAISHALGGNSVIPYLIDLTPADLSGPLSQFQAICADEKGTRKLFQVLNKASKEAVRLTDIELLQTFSIWWLEILRAFDEMGSDTTHSPMRKDRELLEETLELVRQLVHRQPQAQPALQPDRAWAPGDFIGRTPQEIFAFFEGELIPEATMRARREWEFIDNSDLSEITSHAVELAKKRAQSLGLGELWERWWNGGKFKH